MKICKQCTGTFEIDLFYVDRKNKDGRRSICKKCDNDNKNERNRKNKDHVNLLQRQNKAKNPEHHRMKGREKMRHWREKNKEREALRRAQLESSRPGFKARKLREWRDANPEKAKASRDHRRSLRRGAILSDLTAEQWHLIKKTQKFRCAYCGKKKPLTQDHITPLAKGGSHTMGNIMAVCQSCNSKKFTNPAPIPVQPMLPLAV